MPSYKVHLSGGIITYLLVYKLTTMLHIMPYRSAKYHFILAGATLLGSIFPDIDVESKMQRLFWLVVLITLPITLILHKLHLFIGIGLISLSLLFIHHRTLTHRWWFLTLLPLAGALLAITYCPSKARLLFSICIYFVSGAFSHVLLDRGIQRFFK